MLFSELVKKIEEIAPVGNAATWDKSGIQVASEKTAIQTLAVCLDPSPASVAKALAVGADCILSHHPLALSPELPSRLDDYHHVLRLLFGGDVALYAAHTSLDTNPAGPVGWLAGELRLSGVRILEPLSVSGERSRFGYGLVGEMPDALSMTDFFDLLKPFVDLELATICGNIPRLVKRVAYCTGSGASLYEYARAASADIYITGDVKYHNALVATCAILDVGHHSLEEEMMRRMALLLQQSNLDAKVVFIPSSSPFRRIDSLKCSGGYHE